MARTISTAAGNALQAGNVPLVVFVELQLPSGSLYLCNSAFPREWNGHTWLGGGRFTGLQPIEEGVTPSAAGLALVITGIESTYVSSIMTEHYQGQPAYIWIAPLDDDYDVIADPVLVFSGRMDEPTIELGETATITLALENRWADWDRPRIRRFNDADQQAEYPGDKGFEYAEAMETADLSWGLYKGPAAPRINIPKGAKEYLINPFLAQFRPIQKLFKRMF